VKNCIDDLTVVIATYNGQSFIRETIENALLINPSKIIISDDASTDDTSKIISGFVKRLPGKVLYMRNEINLGLTRNWNHAIGCVETPYCLKLDHDDLVLARYVESAIEFFRSNRDVGIIAGKGLPVESASITAEEYKKLIDEPESWGPANISIYAGDLACKFVLKWNPYAFSSSTIYKIDAWRKVHGFDERLSYCNDREIWFRIAEKFKIGFYDGLSGIQRIHKWNFTKSVKKNEMMCFEFDHMFSCALKFWNNSSLKPLFRKNLLIVGKAYLGSAWRILLDRPSEVPLRVRKGIATLVKAFMI